MKQVCLSSPNIIQPNFKDNFNIFKRKPVVLLDKITRWRKCASLVNLTDKARLRLEWIIFYETVGKKDAHITSQHFGIAPKTLYKWLNKFAESKENIRVLEEKSRRPHNLRQWEVTSIEEARIIKLRKKYIHWLTGTPYIRHIVSKLAQ